MTDERAALVEGVELLERAISYTGTSLRLVTPDFMANPTPCRDWDLAALLGHMNDSMAAMYEAVAIGRVDPAAYEDDLGPDPDPVETLCAGAARLLGAWANVDHPGDIPVGDRPLASSIMAGAGAIEIVVHGWDVAWACGHHRPLPDALADELLELGPYLVTDADRPSRFATPVPVSPLASPGERLLAFLGRAA